MGRLSVLSPFPLLYSSRHWHMHLVFVVSFLSWFHKFVTTWIWAKLLHCVFRCHKLLRHFSVSACTYTCTCGVDESMGINISSYYILTFQYTTSILLRHSLLIIYEGSEGFFRCCLTSFWETSWKQLSVMGMSLRIGMRSPISLTLKPRVRITLIAASHDSLKPPVVCLGFYCLTTIRQTTRVIRNTKYSSSALDM